MEHPHRKKPPSSHSPPNPLASNSIIPKPQHLDHTTPPPHQQWQATTESSSTSRPYNFFLVNRHKNQSRSKHLTPARFNYRQQLPNKIRSRRQQQLANMGCWMTTALTKMMLTRAAQTINAGARDSGCSLVIVVVRAKVLCTWDVIELMQRDWKCVLSA